MVLAMGAAAAACGDGRDPGFTPNLGSTTTTGVTNTTTTTTSDGGGSSVDSNLCSCIQALRDEGGSGECTSCRSGVAQAGGECNDELQYCEVFARCLLVDDCVEACPATGDPDCVAFCLFDYGGDNTAEGRQAYRDWVGCWCSRCSGSCNATGTTLCESAGTGGAGGAGGAGTGGQAAGGTGGGAGAGGE